MRIPATFILFCLLLLPGLGSGQGIEISDNSKPGESLDYESIYYKIGKDFRLVSATPYIKNKVRKVELFRSGSSKQFMITFDKQGRVIKSKNCGNYHSYNMITDSIFEPQKLIVIDSFFYREVLTRIDTLVIDKIELRFRNNKIVRYDKACYKSYKSGYYLNERNEYYRRLSRLAYACYTARPLLDYGSYTPPKRIDGNFDPHWRFYLRTRAQPGTKPILRRKPYRSEKFYLTQTKTSYLNISGTSVNKTSNLIKKNNTKLYVRGEYFNTNNLCFFEVNSGMRYGCIRYDPPPLPPISKGEQKDTNNKNLTDTVFAVTYYEQAKDKPCVKPKDSLFTDYLRGYSGEPQKYIKYYFRYEYFDE